MKGKGGRKEGRGTRSTEVQKAYGWKKWMWKMGEKEDCHEGERERERQQREDRDNVSVCVVFVAVAFWRTEGLCVSEWLRICFPIHPICGIDPLPNCEQNKKAT